MLVKCIYAGFFFKESDLATNLDGKLGTWPFLGQKRSDSANFSHFQEHYPQLVLVSVWNTLITIE